MNRAIWLLGAALLALGLWRIDASPQRLWDGLAKLGWLISLMWPPSFGGVLPQLLQALAETVAMAFLGTLIAAVLAIPLAACGARNVARFWPLRFAARRFSDSLRGIDTLIWALVFVSAVGMGPFAGILAIAVPDIGVLARTASESLEAADRRPREAIVASGGGALLSLRWGLMPQVLPEYVAQVLYLFESNTRSATILGVVGAGGIGLALTDRMRINQWDEVAGIVLLILVAVAAIDTLSRRIRMRLIRA
ncbi:phosphonate ABC transporter, permease protein PhnE [Humitalea sp. 24SJ18S-53]|uniref:phosphonate ABC transporter, permease protein PhnE n=1 Tax=Humitalea sp. 24SJ18S-53 TaxID=3422307 RepID=UPI003D67AD92